MKIFKYPLRIAAWRWLGYVRPLGNQTVDMPKNASILCCQAQCDVPCLWATVDPDAPLEQRTFFTVRTGHDITFDLAATRYIGTVQLRDGTFIHVFELVE